MKSTFKELLVKMSGCEEGVEWVQDKTVEESVQNTSRGDWLLWGAEKVEIGIQPITLAKARCAKTVIHLMTDQRSIDAVLAAEKFGLGQLSAEELRVAHINACKPAYTNKPSIKAGKAARLSADITGGEEASKIVLVAAACYLPDLAAREQHLKLLAEICRETIGDLLISRVNEMLSQNN